MSWRYREHKHSEPFYENDVALHTVLVTGVPKEMNTAEAEGVMREVFSRIFSEPKVVMTRAQPLQDDLY